MADPLAEYRPAIIVDIYLDGGTQRVASKDFYDSSGNYYKGTLVETPNISRTLTDLYYGVEETTSVTLQISNVSSNVDDTWDDIVITNADELRGREVLIQRNDPSDGTSFELRGKIVEYSLGTTIELMVETRKDYIFDTLLPQALVTNDAPWTATAIDVGKPVNICFGKCRNVPLRNIQNDRVNDYYDYLIGYGQIEGLWIDHVNGFGVKRDGVLVNTAEYGTNAPDYDNGEIFDGTQAAPFPGYAFIRFTREQMNFSGAFHNLTADIKGLVLDNYEEETERNFAEVIQHLLSDTTWGLSESIDAASFATAESHLSVASYMCDGAITEQRQATDVLNDLLFVSRATLVRGSDGEWEMSVDVAGTSVLNLGDNDGYYNNCKVVKTSAMNASEAIYTAIVHYDIDSYNTDLPYKELSHATGLDFGITRTYDLPFVMENVTAKKVLSYITRRSIYSDKTALIQGGMECRDLLCGDIVTLTAPARNISSKDYMIEGITKNVASFELRCREYDAAIYGDEVIADPTAQTSTKPTVLGPIAIIGSATLGDGSTQSGSIDMQLAPDQGDVVIKSGKDDFTTADPGFIIGVDDSDGDKTKLYLGDATDYVYWDGTSLVVSGNISAVTGTIGGWTIGATTLESANIVLDDGNDRIRSTNYVSGIAGAGFTLEPDLLEVGNIAARGIIRTAVFQKDVVSAVGGNLIVLPADVLDADMTAADSSTLTIEGNETFAVGDLLRIKDGTDDEWLEVTNAGSAPTYTVTRDKGGDYGADANPAWTKGATVVNYGQSGDGFVYMTASETNAPYMSVVTHAGSPWDTLTTRVRIGNLNGFLGYDSDLYGIAIGETNAYLKYDPTNGMRIKGLVEIIGNPALQNMLNNPGFEETDGTNAYYWTSGSGFSTETSGGDNSNKYFKIVRSGTNKTSYYQDFDGSQRYFEVNEGEVYEYGGSCKSDGTCSYRIGLAIYDKDKGNVSWHYDVVGTDATWTNNSGTYIVPAGKKFVSLWIQAGIDDGWAAFDNVYLKRVDEKAWSFTHASDRTKIDGGNIYTNTVTATQIAANTITASQLKGTAFGTLEITSGKIQINSTDALEIKSGGNIKVLSGGDIILIGDDSSPGKVRWQGSSYSIDLYADSDGNHFYLIPTNSTWVYTYIGTSGKKFNTINLYASEAVKLYSDGNINLSGNPSNIMLDGNKQTDLAHAAYAFDDAYADDWHNVADLYHLDVYDDLAALTGIQKGTETDPRNDLPLIDDDTLPEWMLTRSKNGKEILRDPDGKPWLSNKVLFSTIIGAIKQLDAKIEAMKNE